MHRRRPQRKAYLELAALIDIVFILLIFFAVNSSLITKNSSIPLTLPQSNTSQELSESITISLKGNNSIYINKQPIPRTNFVKHLQSLHPTEHHNSLILSADKSLPYDNIISLLDLIREAGWSKIALHVEKKVNPN